MSRKKCSAQKKIKGRQRFDGGRLVSVWPGKGIYTVVAYNIVLNLPLTDPCDLAHPGSFGFLLGQTKKSPQQLRDSMQLFIRKGQADDAVTPMSRYPSPEVSHIRGDKRCSVHL